MKLVASMPVRDELDRYLRPCVTHLLTYCDEVRVLDDGSTDGTYEWLEAQPRVSVRRNTGARWTEHEGEIREALLDWTLSAHPTHVLAIDADEFVPEGELLREVVESNPGQRTFTLRMVEVWDRSGETWRIRVDGGWRVHPVAICFRAPEPSERGVRPWLIEGQQLGGGRVPRLIRRDERRAAMKLALDVVHLGWSDPAERAARAGRYDELDGGRFHSAAHLDSILWPDSSVELETYPAPAISALLR